MIEAEQRMADRLRREAIAIMDTHPGASAAMQLAADFLDQCAEAEPVARICTDAEMRHRDGRWGRVKWIEAESELPEGALLYTRPAPAYEKTQQEIDRLTRELTEARAEIEAFAVENDTLRHQVIACGVAASHPDVNLSRTGAYAGKWNSQQAESVRNLRAERDALRAALNAIARIPAMGFPDPGAHSARAYHEAVFVAWSRSNQTARAALAQIEKEKANGDR